MRGLAFLLFLIPAAAGAQSAQTPAQLAPDPDDVHAVTCDQWYPTAERAAGVDGDTILSVRIAADTSLHDPAVVQSSGNAALDRAAMECAQHQKLEKVTWSGKPIEFVWQIKFAWRHETHSFFNPPLLAADASLCGYPPLAVRLGEEGITIVKYRIGPDGAVSDMTLDQPSGFDRLDQTAMVCSAARRYPPPLVNGAPGTIEWRSRFVWRLQ